LTQKHVPEWKWAIEKLEWAKQIVDYPVSMEEYHLALHEIEYLVNPLLQNTNHVIERTPLSHSTVKKTAESNQRVYE
jgi:hypothetical protein